MQIGETIYPQTRMQWREWLHHNHRDKKEIWITYYKKHTKKPTISYQDAVDEALCFGWIDGLEKRIDDERFVQRFTPRKNKSHWSETNIIRYYVLVDEGRMTKSGTDAFERKNKT